MANLVVLYLDQGCKNVCHPKHPKLTKKISNLNLVLARQIERMVHRKPPGSSVSFEKLENFPELFDMSIFTYN